MKSYIFMFAAVSLLACKTNNVNELENDAGPVLISFIDAGSSKAIKSPNADAGSVSTPPNEDASSPPHCGDVGLPLCQLGDNCRQSSDCQTQACNYASVCVEEKSCVGFYGGVTCGAGEMGDPTAQHESCCKSLPIGEYYSDPTHLGKKIYVDKYEITAGRMRAFIQAITKQMGKPDVKAWIAQNKPEVWNDAWNVFLPSDFEGGTITINRLLLGDPRHDHQTQAQAGPGVIIPPDTDQTVDLGINHQFGAQVYADVHGNNCGVFPDAYGFPTYYYPPEVLTKNGEVPRHDGIALDGSVFGAQDLLDSKSLNCSTNIMFQALCHFDGGELATSEVLDFITESPSSLGNNSGCGTQIDYHSVILDPAHVLPDPDVRTGGKCPDLNSINATFDAGGKLPTVFVGGVEVSDPLYNDKNFLNWQNYLYPDFSPTVTSEKVWQVSAPGRTKADNIKGWMDLAGNLSEAVLETQNGTFTGNFGLRYRGLGYGSARSDLNVSLMPGETILRIQRPEVKSGLVGARCMYFK